MSSFHNPRNFRSRPQKEQDIFVQITWCDSCYESDLGMFEPVEYQKDKKIFVEGKCTRCGSRIISEIVKGSSAENTEDYIYPIHDRSVPPRTFLPKTNFAGLMPGSYSHYGYSSLHSIEKPRKILRFITWLIIFACISIMVFLFVRSLIFEY